jgi:hypothetical protein
MTLKKRPKEVKRKENEMALDDALDHLHCAYRHATMDYQYEDPSVQKEVFKSWRNYAVLTVNDLQNKPVAPHDLDNSVSEVLLGIILGFDPAHACCSEDDLVHAMHFDPLLQSYIRERLSDRNLFHVMKDRPELEHKDLLRSALDRIDQKTPMRKAA